ncbi:hypothetical protein MCAMS1_01768 [biofilm metagenome]
MSKAVHSEKLKRMAFHTAGQAVAIYLRNKRMGLSAAFFRLIANPLDKQSHKTATKLGNGKNYTYIVDGGRLIQALPVSLVESTVDFTRTQKLYYEKAFDADIINMLAGPVAEAKYVAQRDNEIITPRLVNFNSLGFYNGLEEMGTVLSYLKCLNLPPDEQQRKMVNLYLASFSFVGEIKIWNNISQLANHILTTDKDIFEADEIISFLAEARTENRANFR